MNNMADFEEFENTTKLEIVRMKDTYNESKIKQIIQAIADEIETCLLRMKQFIKEQKDNEKAKEAIEKMKIETTKILTKTKAFAEDIKEDDKVKDFIAYASQRMEAVNEMLNENEMVNKVKDSVNNTIDHVKNDASIKQGIKKVKKTTLHFTSKALSSIEKALKDDEEVIIHDFNKEENE